jgi:long-subunit acyl-CoA synthetase (AMP-forming)
VSTACKLFFTTLRLGAVDNSLLLSRLTDDSKSTPWLEEVIILYGENNGLRTYEEVIRRGVTLPDSPLNEVTASLDTTDICMLLFTSGSTGNPKAASLTH